MKYHPTVYLLLFLFAYLPLQAQQATLARKGSLGVRLEAMNEDRAATAGLTGVRGALVTEVLAGGTGTAIGLQAQDIILSINGDNTDDVSGIVQRTSQWRAGQQLEVEVWRNGQSVKLQGRVRGKPMESSDIAEVIYDAVPFRDGQLRSIIHKPKADGVFPLVVYLQGFDCSSIDDYHSPNSPTRRFVDGLVSQGYAVFRVEKPGVGDSEGDLRCEDIGYQTELAAFDAAMRSLSRYDFVDQENIFYFGHSLGGVTAPLLAARHQPRGVIVYGTVFESWYEYMQKVFRDQAYVRGDDWIETENTARSVQQLLARLFVNRESPSQMQEDESIKALLAQGVLDYRDDRFVGRHYTFWQELNDANPVQAWHDAGVHTLAIYGEYDLHAISADGAQKIAALVEHYHPGKGTFLLLPGTEHGFAQVPSMKSYVQMRRNGQFNRRYVEENFNTAVISTITDWMDPLIGRSHNKVGRQ